ncbi:unnamed protein product [Rangifer tarandus platyrhynchus]|uniref:Uncharacterized protein n=1 Tax=Rangifer tarandus platyrhynchus TaxID=3082113 RepID=A0AC59ZDK6_RANTA
MTVKAVDSLSKPEKRLANEPQTHLKTQDPTTTLKKNPDLSCASPPFQPPAGPRGARGPRDPGVPRAAPNPGTILSLSCAPPLRAPPGFQLRPISPPPR